MTTSSLYPPLLTFENVIIENKIIKKYQIREIYGKSIKIEGLF